MDNEQLVIRIRAGIDVAENMLQLWQQNKGYICKIVNAYREYAEEDDLLSRGLSGPVGGSNPLQPRGRDSLYHLCRVLDQAADRPVCQEKWNRKASGIYAQQDQKL